MTREPVGIVSTRRLAVVATVVRAFSRSRRGKTILEPESGWVRANFDRFVAIHHFAALDGLRAVEHDRGGLASHLGDPPCASDRRLQIA